MRSFWETLPLAINPVVITIGQFSLSWYALCFLFGAIVAVVFLYWQPVTFYPRGLSRKDFWSLASSILWGVLIGARLGYIVFYADTQVYWLEPWRIFSPYDFERGLWTGIRGMSFFGGLAGGVLALYFFARKRGIPFFTLSDWLVPALPIALFFGRMGNFMNGELFGRPTQSFWGMRFFPDDIVLRHPSQLYEALVEGGVLFLLLWLFRKRHPGSGLLSALFLMGYGGIRFILEFFREPDQGSFSMLGMLTFNQMVALLLVLVGLVLSLSLRRMWYTKSTSLDL